MATRRIQRELKEIHESPSRHWTASPAADDLFEWQFAVRGPPGTDFEGGIYTGRLVLPVNYPLAPPSITMLTPNGRWEVGKKICLSNTNYHPDQWQPAWGIRTMMEALRSQFPLPGDGAIAAIDWPSDLRRKLAVESLDFVCGPGGTTNRELLPELSSEEMQEDQPDPTPPELRPPTIVPPAVLEESSSAASSPGQADSAPLGGDAQPAVSLSTAAAPAAPSSASSAIAAAPVACLSAASAPSAASLATPSPPAAAPAAQAASRAVAAPLRRRREGQRPQRRSQQPVIIQLLKPPTTSHGWALLMIDIMIFLLTLSFMYMLSDIVRNPPQILDPLPDASQAKSGE